MIGFTYRHHTARDLMAPDEVLPDYIFDGIETCRSFMARCLRDPEDHVVLEGQWMHNPKDWEARTTFRPTAAHPYALPAADRPHEAANE
jgi:hypothetical protein